MSGDVTYQALERLTNMPNRSGNQGDRIAGQLYYDVEFTGGSISGVTLTDVTINGTITTRTERVITASGPVTVASDDYVITIDKTVPTATTVTLPSVPTTSRSLIIKDGQGQAGANNITISGNGNTIDGSATYVINVSWGAAELIYNGTEWNIISSYATNGNVVGAAFSTDNAISRFDGTTGRNIQNSTVTIGDTGIFAGASIDTASAVNVLKINGTSLTDVTGTGTVVLSTSPTLTTPNIGSATGSVTGNAGTASKLQTAHLIGNVSFDGSADITPQQLSLASEASDTTCFPLFINTASSAAQQPKYNTSLTYNASTNALATGLLTSNTLNLNASTNQILFDADGTNVGTMTMAALTAARTWTLPNVSGTLLTTSGAATVSAKTFDNTNTAVFKDNGFSLEDDVDATKTLQWQLSGITTAATRTWTVQDVSGTVYVTGGQQVSVADGGTGRGTATAYAVLCGGTTSTGAQQSIASVGTSGQVLTSNGPAALPTFQPPSSSDSFASQLLHVREEQPDGTASGTFTAGAYRTRVLNTVKTNQITSATLVSNQISLPSGTYFIIARAPGFQVSAHAVKLRNITSSSDIIIGGVCGSSSISGDNTYSFVNGRFALASTTTIELQHQCLNTKTTNGFGNPAGFGANGDTSTTEVYSDVMIWKVA